jgi:hypothetical protein
VGSPSGDMNGSEAVVGSNQVRVTWTDNGPSVNMSTCSEDARDAAVTALHTKFGSYADFQEVAGGIILCTVAVRDPASRQCTLRQMNEHAAQIATKAARDFPITEPTTSHQIPAQRLPRDGKGRLRTPHPTRRSHHQHSRFPSS